MATTKASVHDRHRRNSGLRSCVFEPGSREHGTTRVDALVTADALRPHQTGLDLGCGEGPWLRSLTRQEARDLGMDGSAASIAAARPPFGATGTALMAADAGQMPRDQEN